MSLITIFCVGKILAVVKTLKTWTFWMHYKYESVRKTQNYVSNFRVYYKCDHEEGCQTYKP